MRTDRYPLYIHSIIQPAARSKKPKSFWDRAVLTVALGFVVWIIDSLSATMFF